MLKRQCALPPLILVARPAGLDVGQQIGIRNLDDINAILVSVVAIVVGFLAGVE